MKRLSRFVEALRLGAVLDQKTPVLNDFAIVPAYETVRDGQGSLAVASWGTNHTIFVNDNLSGTFQVVGATVVFDVTSTSGTLDIEVATGTQAVGSGTNQTSASMSLSGTARTAVNAAIIAAPTTIAAGSRINIIIGGTTTGLSKCEVTVVLKRIT